MCYRYCSLRFICELIVVTDALLSERVPSRFIRFNASVLGFPELILCHFPLFSLFTNSYSLNNVGPITEKVFGPGRFLATYLVSGATGNLLSAYNRCVGIIAIYVSC